MQTRAAVLVAALSLPFALVACGDPTADRDIDAEISAMESERAAEEAAAASAEAAASASAEATAWPVPTFQDAGPGVCVDLITDQLGTDLQVHEITSFFSGGPDLEDPPISGEVPAKGELTTCSISYQDPDDEIVLLQRDLDLETGEFEAPVQLEIQYSGDASEFDLDDYVMDLGELDVSGLPDIVAAEEPALEEVFSDFAWDAVRLMAPGPGSEVHELRLDVAGLIASNGLEENGAMYLTPQGEVTLNNLTNF